MSETISFPGYFWFNYHRLYRPSIYCRYRNLFSWASGCWVLCNILVSIQVAIFCHLVTLGIALHGLLRWEFGFFILMFFTALWQGPSRVTLFSDSICCEKILAVQWSSMKCGNSMLVMTACERIKSPKSYPKKKPKQPTKLNARKPNST